MNLRNLVYLFLFFASVKVTAQDYGRLIIYHAINLDGKEYTLNVYKGTSTVAIATRTYDCQEEIELDSLDADIYRVVIRETNSQKLFLTREISVIKNNLSTLHVDLDIWETINPTDTFKITKRRSDAELNLGYQNGRLSAPNSVFLSGFMIGLGAHLWNATRPHMGFMLGYGLNYRYNLISGDTSFITDPKSYKKEFQAYNYLDAHIDFKVRLSGANQQIKGASPDFLLELGGIYNFPIYFRYKGNYEGNKKIEARGIHQFTDFRAFVNFGFYPVLFFYEYRLSDFVIGNYPELPRSTFGIRILLTALINDRDG